MLHLYRIPARPVEVVDLEDEVVLKSFQPLHGQTVVCHPGDGGQVVLAERRAETVRLRV